MIEIKKNRKSYIYRQYIPKTWKINSREYMNEKQTLEHILKLFRGRDIKILAAYCTIILQFFFLLQLLKVIPYDMFFRDTNKIKKIILYADYLIKIIIQSHLCLIIV